ncbi:MAG TPA: hypothetical protein DCO77_10475 [Nitrospiraceae bacterium]|nr:hypothetical protein [Nitrospiraceae bacterium]
MEGVMKKRWLLSTGTILALVICFSGQVHAGKEMKPKNVVVMNFTSAGCNPQLSTAASVALRGVLVTFDQSRYSIAERQVLNDFLSGSGLAFTAPLSKKAAKTAARKLDADYFVEGDLRCRKKAFTLAVRLVDAATKAIVRTHTIRASSMRELMQKLPEIGLAVLDIAIAVQEKRADPFAPPANRVAYDSWYSDVKGVHKGGQIILNIQGDTVTGTSIESYGKAAMNGSIQKGIIIGVYKASYGWGNFEFAIEDNWKKLKGHYYQVSNGAKGEWSGVLK